MFTVPSKISWKVDDETGSFVKFRHLDLLKWSQMAQNPQHFLMVPSANQKFLTFSNYLKGIKGSCLAKINSLKVG